MEKLLGRRMIPQWSDENTLYLTQNNLVIAYDYNSGSLTKLFKVEKGITSIRDFIKERIIRRAPYRNFLTKDFGISHLVHVKDGLFYVIWDQLYVYNAKNDKKVARIVDLYNKFAINPPLKNGLAVHAQSRNVYFGEYITGRKDVVRIIKIDPFQNISVAYTFDFGSIQHVHSVTYDAFRNRLWITTGDKDESCAIYYTDDEFISLHVLGHGDQTWRAVSVIPTASSLYWGMDAGKDAPKEAINKIFRFDFDTATRHEEETIGNPAYHSVQGVDGKLYMGVNFEPGRKQDTPEESAIWVKETRNPLAKWTKLTTFPYKPASLSGFSRYGYVYLPVGLMPANTLVYAANNASNKKYATYIVNVP